MSDAAAAEGFRLERLLPLACIAGAVVLLVSELMTTFELTPEGVEAQCSQSAIDRHHYAPIVLAAFAIVAVITVLLTASKPAAVAVAASGVLALLIFLVIDLPDANNVGTLGGTCGSLGESFIPAKAEPQAGFWLELIGSLALAISGLALASLTPDQLRELRPRWLRAQPPADKGERPRRRPTRGTRGKELLTDAERFGEELAPGNPSPNESKTAKKRPTRAKKSST